MKPILFNSEMVKAILDGRKTTTRRIIKGIPESYTELQGIVTSTTGSDKLVGSYMFGLGCQCVYKKPLYQKGDVLYVRETFNSDWCDHTIYKADGGSAKEAGYSAEPKWHPSIHMPKEAARIFLRVTNLGAERVQEITEEQALAEGLIPLKDQHGAIIVSAKGQFKAIWIELYGIDSWNTNPFVWIIKFERCDNPKLLGGGEE